MAEEELKVAVTTTADLKGFEATKKGAAEVGAAMSSVGKAGAEGFKPIQDGAKAATAAKRELRDAVKGVGLEFPVLQRVALAALNPLTAAVGLVASAVGALFSGMKELQSAASNTMPWTDSTKALEAQAKALDDLVIQSAAYDRSLRAIAEATQTVTDKTNANVKALQEKTKFQLEASKANEAAALAAIDARPDLTPAQKSAQKLLIQRRGISEREGIESGAEQQELALRQGERRALRQEAGTLDQEIGASERRLAGMVSPAEFDARLAIALENKAAAKTQGKERDAERKGITVSIADTVDMLLGTDLTGLGRARQSEAELGEVSAGQVRSLQAGRAGATIDFQAEQDRLSRLRSRRTEVEKRQQDLGGDIEGTLRSDILEDQFRPGIRRAEQFTREAPVLAGIAAAAAPPPSEFSGTAKAGQGLNEIGQVGQAATSSIERFGTATVEALQAIATKSDAQTAAILQIQEQLKNNRPPQ